ncbi:MAG: STAS domain-containing protein [Acetobacteraceae bacterium]|nr:STAS domain-containing protein [Acetobacteraceae bacterium]
MRLEIVPIDAGTTRLRLIGRMDGPGCERIETSFTAASSAAAAHVLVDMSEVDYVGSLGIRLLISNARVVHRRGRKIVIIGAQPQPQDVFETVALADLIPIARDDAEAVGLLAGG